MGLKRFTEVPEMEEMINIIEEDGVLVIDNYVPKDVVEKMHDEVLKKCKSKAGHYPFGRNLKGENLKTFGMKSATSQTFNQDWMKELYKEYTGKDRGFCSSILATWDYIHDKGLGRNGWLHFDRGNCFKYFIYLTDVDEDSGAFTACPGSRAEGKKLREKAWHNQSNYDVVPNRIEKNYKNLMGKYPEVPIIGKAGTLIIFDTDCFHKGGEVKKGKSRLVVRAHCT